ncbi:hypothetical protein COUCH_05615 [Couchioplanes caeruleus]|uniref:hypothetical protein n=1 Tax=Couchioplanes caeruleus TaxID=56438 RepID=UPI0020C13D03|nr:hypothetical protein [Couchioplanes caeruleus]UQU65796.1 hypothetical protein COUCH_05615 [Couchioplanes caeruleus]
MPINANRLRRRMLAGVGAVIAASSMMLAGVSAPAYAANPYTAKGVCGSGYNVQRSHKLPGATAYQLYNGTTTCVVTLKTTSLGKATKVTAGLQVKGGSWAYDTGAYTYYAGPVKQRSKGKCVRYFGYSKSSNFTSTWANCG